MRVDRAADLIKSARLDIGMSQAALASAAGMQQPTISAYESGRQQPRAESLERILRAAQIRPSIPLSIYADDILIEANRHHLVNVRVFGSAIRGHDTPNSDIDLLVGLTSEASLFDLGGFAHAVEEMTGFEVDLLTDDIGDDPHFAHVLGEAVPL
ncbi:putative nucleotidyltransferase [Curtobacterium luteum]|uniref:Nucleotidyltransferase n=1 Tax=Curtobacterium luteum TaxID=33881 RepID=A0A8H9KYQ9_9MICO|nr:MULTISPECIES: XRE family transcriptional regulator [Curtobacterium]MBM7804153.1 putative nucleotidyltransferase [Curtobacterium luteum]NUU51038.1 XRE family transcriptional regulator [Curtobacterium luteum]GGK98133.1 hypothetical protein GCM10009769_15360 [Curtobacterium luteum]